jgi:thiamine-phosphate pyrophosphorylase
MLRIVDANLNRVAEGLRVLEDIARFLLNDFELSQRLKDLRHELLPSDWSLQSQLLGTRDSEGDIAAFLDEAERGDIASVATANAKRVQESLRVLEEVAKVHPLTLDWSRYKRARFTLYELERRLVLRLLRRDKVEQISRLYVIIDLQALKGRSEVEITREAIQGGARVIQLRDKGRSKRELLPIAQGLRRTCALFGVPFIINDHLDLALATDADGLHLGQDDLPLPIARRILPLDKVLGCSTSTVEQAVKAEEDGADYIAVGSIYETTSKLGARLAGLETLRRIKEAVSVPVVAIGGINEENLAPVIAAGADAIAVISAVLGADDAKAAAHRLAAKIEASHALETKGS